MDFLVLTKAGGWFAPVVEVFGWIMNALFNFTNLFGVVNIGLSIILFTVVTKLILFPLTLKQQKSSKIMTIMQPEIQAIQNKYKGKNDNDSMMKMNVETRAVYEKYGTSMTSGCLPLLIQLPLMLALYQVIYKVPGYVSIVRNYFEQILVKLPAGFSSDAAVTAMAQAHNIPVADLSNTNRAIDLLYSLTSKEWIQLEQIFPAIGEAVLESGERVIDAIESMQRFLGMNVAYTPFNVIVDFFKGDETISILALIMAVLIPVLSGLTQWYSTKLVTNSNPTPDSNGEESASASMMKSMNITMPLMSVFFCFTFPLVIGIYWVVSSLCQMFQQIGVNAYLSKVDVDELIAKNVEKANKKRARKGLPATKITKSASEMMKELQEKEAKEEAKKKEKLEKTQKAVEESTAYYNKDAKPGSLASKAAMVQKYNEKHNK